jgi:hypothetical protein
MATVTNSWQSFFCLIAIIIKTLYVIASDREAESVAILSNYQT